jgi:Haspin like kinase domain
LNKIFGGKIQNFKKKNPLKKKGKIRLDFLFFLFSQMKRKEVLSTPQKRLNYESPRVLDTPSRLMRRRRKPGESEDDDQKTGVFFLSPASRQRALLSPSAKLSPNRSAFMCLTEAEPTNETLLSGYEVSGTSPVAEGKFAAVYLAWTKQSPRQQYALKSQLVRDQHRLSDAAYRELMILEELARLATTGQCVNFVSIADWAKSKRPLRVDLMLLRDGDADRQLLDVDDDDVEIELLGDVTPPSTPPLAAAAAKHAAAAAPSKPPERTHIARVRPSIMSPMSSAKSSRVSVSTPTSLRRTPRTPMTPRTPVTPVPYGPSSPAFMNYVLEYAPGRFDRTMSWHRFRSLALQTIYALYVAQRRLEFVHYDLHLNNLLTASMPAGVRACALQIDDGTRWYVTGELVKIADFGLSRLRLERSGVVLYNHKMRTRGVFSTTHDICQLADGLKSIKMEPPLGDDERLLRAQLISSMSTIKSLLDSEHLVSLLHLPVFDSFRQRPPLSSESLKSDRIMLTHTLSTEPSFANERDDEFQNSENVQPFAEASNALQHFEVAKRCVASSSSSSRRSTIGESSSSAQAKSRRLSLQQKNNTSSVAAALRRSTRKRRASTRFHS